MATIVKLSTGPVPLADPVAAEKLVSGSPMTGLRPAPEGGANCLATGLLASDVGAWEVDYPGAVDVGQGLAGTHPVKLKLPNTWGLYDMHGNVAQFTQDWYGPYGGDVQNPIGPANGAARVVRGGNWAEPSQNARSAARGQRGVGVRDDRTGLRPVRTL